MSDHKTPVSAETKQMGRTGPLAPAAYTQIVQLAAGTVAPHRYLKNVFTHLAEVFDSPFAALHVQLAAEVVQEENHRGPTDPAFWKQAVSDILTDCLTEPVARAKRFTARDHSTTLVILAAPLFDITGRSLGACAFVVGPINTSEIGGLLATLQSLLAVAGSCLSQLGNAMKHHVSAMAPSSDPAQVPNSLPLHSNSHELAFSAINALRNKMDLEQVSLATVVRKRARLLAISGLDEIPHRSPGVAAMIAAMEECLDAGRPIVCQPGNHDLQEKYRGQFQLHAQWQASCKGDNVACLPLLEGDSTMGILSLRSRTDRPFTDQQLVELLAWTANIAPVLALTLRAHRSLLSHASDVAVNVYENVLHKKTLPYRLGLLLAIVSVAFMLWVPMPYSVRVPCRVAADHARRICAPFAGVLTTADVLSGTMVQQGQVLCNLDTHDLRLQRTELEAQSMILETEENKALASGNVFEARIASANRQVIQERLLLIQRRIDSAVIRSPMAGTLISGDLRERIGEAMPLGESLFEIAPPDSWKIELSVPEHVAAGLITGLTGDFALNSKPEKSYGLRLTQVAGEGLPEQGRMNFKVDAALTAHASWFRPGMEGIARVHMGNRSIAWQLFHRLIDPLRVRGWL